MSFSRLLNCNINQVHTKPPVENTWNLAECLWKQIRHEVPSIWTDRIPRSRSCWLLFWARMRSRSAASRGMLKVTRTLFHGSIFCSFSLLDSSKENRLSAKAVFKQARANNLVRIIWLWKWWALGLSTGDFPSDRCCQTTPGIFQKFVIQKLPNW